MATVTIEQAQRAFCRQCDHICTHGKCTDYIVFTQYLQKGGEQ